ncbi:hypothetical protein P167DRAFT_609639 [Morchella conica CCBAS932]|uniref:BTB domain-containing protein n=1 Tax=Morchella conica CCBAS932 TaxID=1392247 RepID=A0A3N4KMX3_9PEZI|nr:hypothetical protein P167DRAFT_609639 [Morchella conica CCBAS932]
MSDEKKTIRRQCATIEIAPEGDVILEVESPTGTARFRVLSSVLCLASPVFRVMLGRNSNFKEACELRNSDSAPYVVPLDESDPGALAVILNVFHLRNDHVPKTVSFANLYKLAVICDKYDCATAVALWVPIWTGGSISSVLQPGNGKWLFIAWALKIEHIFAEVSKKIVLEGFYSDPNSALLTTGGFPAVDTDTPEVVVEEIIQRRKQTIRSMLNVATSFLQRYYHNPGDKPRCRHLVRSDQCDMMILGSLIKVFQSMKIIPPGFGTPYKQEEMWLESVTSLDAALRGFQLHFLQVVRDKPCKPNHYDNTKCYIHGAVLKCGDHTKCSFLPEFYMGLDSIKSGVQGLSLYDFKSRQMPPKGESQGGAPWETFQFMGI